MSDTPDTATLADLLARATPGPWHAGRSDMMSYDASGTVAFKNVYADDERGGVHLGDPMPLTVAKAVDESALYDGAGAKAIPDAEIMTNAALIALAPALAAEVIRLRAELEAALDAEEALRRIERAQAQEIRDLLAEIALLRAQQSAANCPRRNCGYGG
jgi:hypothetical protein